MRLRHKKMASVLIAAAALSAVFAMGAWAYFSDYEVALGEVSISFQTEIQEKGFSMPHSFITGFNFLHTLQ